MQLHVHPPRVHPGIFHSLCTNNQHSHPQASWGPVLEVVQPFFKKSFTIKMQTLQEAKGQGNLLMHEEIELELLLWCLVRNNCSCWHVSSTPKAWPTVSHGISVVGTCHCTQMLDFNLGGSCLTNVRRNGSRSEAPDGHCLLPSKFLVPALS